MTESSDPMDTHLEDWEARRAIRHQLDETFLVEAAAGTGKTTELVRRLIEVVGEGRGRIEEMVAVTFTEKAAGELKLRIRARLETARLQDPSPVRRARFEAAIASLELAPIGTIHGFCADILREFPIEGEVDPLFDVTDEGAAELLQQEAFTGWFEDTLSTPTRSIQRVLRSSATQTPRELLWSAARKVIARRDFHAPWALPKGDYVEGMRALVDKMAALGRYAVQGSERNPLARALTRFYETAKELQVHQSVQAGDDPLALQDWSEGVLRNFARDKCWNQNGWKDAQFGSVHADAIRAERKALRADFDLWLKRADAHLAATLREELERVVARYESLKARDGRLDYFDLLLRTRDLLENHVGVRAVLRERYSHVFIDEFQDTDPRQTDILWRLVTDEAGALLPGKLFVVGDPKQAIYRFRRADIGVYDRAKARLLEAGATMLILRTGFRSRPDIYALLNRTFEPLFGEGEAGVQAAHVPLAAARKEAGDGAPAQPSVVALPIPRPWNKWGSSFWPRDGEPAAVGAFIAWLLKDSGWKVDDPRTGLRRAIVPEDVCLLMTRLQAFERDIAASFADELERRGLPHVLVAGRAFHEREEIIALRAALSAIEWPGDQLRVYATLRGPLFAFSDNQLLAWRNFAGGFDPLQAVSDVPEALTSIADALRTLAEFHILRNHRPVASTCRALLERTSAHAAMALWPGGMQVLANVGRLVELARRYDRSGDLSFRTFVEQLEKGDQRRESTLLEEGSGGVRVMTVHAAKGLEFPVVVLCDMTAPQAFKRPDHYVDIQSGLWAGSLAGAESAPLLQHRSRAIAEERAEGQRKLYVAATRARDLLVVPAIGDFVPGMHNLNYWVQPLLNALTPSIEERKAATAHPACPPSQGDDTVLFRKPGSKAAACQGVQVRPGLQVNASVWWDPLLLEEAPPPRAGLLGADLLRHQGDAASLAAQSEQSYAAFRERADAVRREGSVPTLRRRTATDAAALEAPQGRPVTVVMSEYAGQPRPSGPRFGTLVHAILADVPFDSPETIEETLDGLAALHRRSLGATEEEERAAIHAVRSALRHPVLRRAAAASDLRREVMLTHRQVDGVVLEGVADMVFRESDPFGGDGWVVVDFKTDLSGDTDLTAESGRAYQVQIELYAAAIEAATGASCEGILLGV